jgi:hypothetical protein
MILYRIGCWLCILGLLPQSPSFAAGVEKGLDVPSSQSEKIQRLIDRIQQLAYCEEPPPEVVRNPQAITAFYTNQREQRETAKPERLRLEAELVAFGDQAVDPIVQNLFYGDIALETEDLLATIGTPKALDTLKKMALGELSRPKFRNGKPRILPSGNAAEKYVRTIKDKTGAVELIQKYSQDTKLVVDGGNLLVDTFKGLRPEDLNVELVESIAAALDKTDHGGASYLACELLAKNTNDKLRRQIADSLISVLDKQSLEKGTEPTWKAGTKFVQLTLVLGRLEKAGPLLAEQSPRYKENLAMTWALTIARGMQGDRSVKPQVLDIIRDSRENLRTTAIVPLETIGTPDDIPVLQEIANTDTYCKEMRVPKRIDDKLYSNYPVQVYPVRDQATRTIEIIQKKQKK